MTLRRIFYGILAPLLLLPPLAGLPLHASRARLNQARALAGERNIRVNQSLELPHKWWLRNRIAGAVRYLSFVWIMRRRS